MPARAEIAVSGKRTIFWGSEVMRSILRVGLISLAILVAQGTSEAPASLLPSSLTIGSSFSRDIDRYHGDAMPMPFVASSWRLTQHLALRSTVAYFRQREQPAFSSEDVFSQFVPLGLGIRVYPGRVEKQAPGFFFDAAPIAFVSRIYRYTGADWKTVRWGAQAGVGVRFSVLDKTRGELGMSFHHMNGTDEMPPTSPYLRGIPFPNEQVWALTLALGFGD